MFKKIPYLLILPFLLLIGCNSDDDINNTTDDEETEDTDITDGTNSYILVELNGGDAYIIDQDDEEVYDFNLNYELGNDGNLLDDGSMVAIAKADSPSIIFGGYGGKFYKQNTDGSIEWEIDYSSENEISHHDVEYLSNGNILFLVWEKIENDDALEIGFNGSFDIYPEAIIEMNPETEEIIWEWHMTDHLVQDYDSTKENYGVIADNPNKIDINYNNGQDDGDITHANGITYDETNDLIYVTVNYYSEVWIIDHSTTTNEAATSTGGTYGLGGDLVYRFGNPETYDNVGEVTLNRVHYPNLLDDGNMLVFANQVDAGQSEVIEFDLPETFTLEAGVDNEPDIVWSFTDEDLYSAGLSSAVRMDNGNTLICEGFEGTLWEVTEEGEIVSENQISESSIWRAYFLSADDPAIEALGIE